MRIVRGDFVDLHPTSPEHMEDVRALAIDEMGTDGAEFESAIADGTVQAFALRPRTGSEHLGYSAVLGNSSLASIALAPGDIRPNLEQLEDAIGLTLAAAFAQPYVDAVIVTLTSPYVRHGWALLKMGFELTADPEQNAKGANTIRMRRSRYEKLVPWNQGVSHVDV